jgi:hypothetical protein
MMKRCTKCRVEYPATHEFFSPDKRNNDGLQARCKNCYRQLAAQNYSDDPDKFRERSKQYYYEHSDGILEEKKQWRLDNPIEAKERDKAWRDANPEKSRAKERKWRDANPEKVSEQTRRYRLENPDKISEWNRNFRKRHPERKKERDRIYREENPEKVRARKRKYYAENGDAAREYSRQWQIRNPEKVSISRQKRRARKRGLPNTLTHLEWSWGIDYWHGRCAYCGKHIEKPTLDHYIALNDVKCPGTIATNMLPSCLACNVSKGDRDVATWLSHKFSEQKGMEIQLSILEYFKSIETE